MKPDGGEFAEFLDSSFVLAKWSIYLVVVILFVVVPISMASDNWTYYKEVDACKQLKGAIDMRRHYVEDNKYELKKRSRIRQTAYNRRNELISYYKKNIREGTRILNHLNQYKDVFCYIEQYSLFQYYKTVLINGKDVPDEHFGKPLLVDNTGVPFNGRYGPVYFGHMQYLLPTARKVYEKYRLSEDMVRSMNPTGGTVSRNDIDPLLLEEIWTPPSGGDWKTYRSIWMDK